MTTVLHIITTLGSGGAERALHLLASRSSGTADPRHIVVSLSGDGVYGAELRDAGIEVRALDMQSRRTSLAGFLQLVQLMREIQPDLVMTWLYHADLLGTIAARMAGISRVIWNIRCSDIDLTHYPPLTRFIVHVLAHLSWLPWGIATNSKQGRRAHEALGYKSARWFYLPNGFDADQWRPNPVDRAKVRAELGIPDTDFIIAMVARVDPQKDHASFLAAARSLAATHANLWFLLIGSDTDKLAICDALRRRTIALGERRDVPRLMRAVDLLASSSNSEGFPNVIGEAMATGVPCVATDVGDTAAIIGEVGRLVPPGDPRALADAMREVIDASADERHALGVRARQRVCENFTVDNCIGRYAQLFRTALASTLNVQNSQASIK